MNKHQIDLVLLRKMFAARNMSDREIAHIMGESNAMIRLHRVKMGFAKLERIECNVCHKDRKPNCFNHEVQGVCIKCQHAKGMKPVNGHGGRPIEEKKFAIRKCLKCDRQFESPLGYAGKPTQYLCDRCNFVNGFIGNQEADYASIRANVTIRDLPATVRYRATV